MSAAIWALAGAAWGQVVPAVDAETFRPTLDGPRLSWVDVASRANRGPFFSVGGRYSRDPLLYWSHDLVSPVLRDVAVADLVGGYSVGPLRLGAAAPVLVRASGWGGGETGLGDVAAAARATVFDNGTLALALDGRLWLPTTSVAAPIGDRGVSGEASLALSTELGPVLFAFNGGYRAIPWAALEAVRVDDAITSRLGLSYGFGERGGLSAEVAGQLVPSAPSAATLPVEALLGGYVRTNGPVGFRLGVGRGLTAAIGAPTLRAVAALTWTSPYRQDDADRDGLVDSIDACVHEPEDDDGYLDEDGCPERPELTVNVVDEAGRPMGSIAGVLSGDRYELPFTGSVRMELDPGAYTMAAHAEGYHDALHAVTVTDGPPRAVELVMQPLRVVVGRERLELRGEIFFESGSDTIRADSFGLLDEVAEALRTAPSIRRLRIEGHTDSVGLPEENLLLSQRRASEVRRYLIAHGIASERLSAVGFGESSPLVPLGDEVPSAENRRVVFIVEQWQPDGGE